MLFDKIATVEYRTVSGVYNNQNYVPDPNFPNGVPVNIQPLNPLFADMNSGMFFKTYRCFTTASGIVEGHRLTVSGTTAKYIVRGRKDYGFMVLPHYELTVERDDR